ncbi:MAG: rhodanese-related sulfurtransferase [Phycisphaerales bacterium]|jgi:rhodanese-related sulfurtransferase
MTTTPTTDVSSPASEVESKTAVFEISPETAAEWVRSGEAHLVDVREDYEHASEAIHGSEHVPFSKFDAGAVQNKCGGVRAVFYCRTGRRARDAAERFGQIGQEAFSLAGGIEGWKAAGRPVHRSEGAPRVDVMRQVQVLAGFLVVTGVALGVLVSPWALVLPGFVGCGLMFAGISGWMLLGVMPWNRIKC